MPRDTEGYRIVETWDTLGMRATRSDDTILESAFVPERYVARVVPAGFAGADPFVLGIFAWGEPTFASIYCGLAQRAMDLAVAGLAKKTSVALGGRSMAYNPMVQWTVAEMAIELDAMTAHVERVAADWSAGVNHGGLWPSKLVACKYRAVEGAKRVVDLAMDTSGGGGMFKGQELERLYRDVRCGGSIRPTAASSMNWSARPLSAFSAKSLGGNSRSDHQWPTTRGTSSSGSTAGAGAVAMGWPTSLGMSRDTTAPMAITMTAKRRARRVPLITPCAMASRTALASPALSEPGGAYPDPAA